MNKAEALSILGLENSATSDEIKKKFRALAKEHHPDRGGKEEEYKKISEAFEYLKSPPKEQPVSDHGFWNAYGGFSNWQDPFRGTASVRVVSTPPPEPIQTNLTLSFKESVLGCQKDIDISRRVKCQDCSGNGIKFTSDKCAKCDGKGKTVIQRGGTGQVFTFVQDCMACMGMGSITEKCKECNGFGGIEKSSTIKVKLQGGLVTGNLVKLNGGGHYFRSNGREGHGLVLLKIKTETHPDMKLSGRNVISSLEIPLVEALKGVEKEVETIDGKQSVKVKAGTKNKEQITLKGYGVERKGDHVFDVKVTYPKDTQPLIEFLEKEE